MAYSNNPNLAKARGNALRAHIMQQVPLCICARKYGVSRSTLYRWKQRWITENHLQISNLNRPSVPVGLAFKFRAARWQIPTCSSAPNTHPRRIAVAIERRILELRKALGRCAVIIREKLRLEGLIVGLSTIQRIIARYGLQKTKRRHIKRTLPRPDVHAPGDLVETDTVHLMDKLTGERKYIITVIDLYSRMAYAKCFTRLLPSNALATILEASSYFGFSFKVVQSDNGPEFSKWYSHRLSGKGMIHRHTRIHRPNDNAHIERFNRTLRDECVGDHQDGRTATEETNRKLGKYLDYYNHERLHIGIQCKTPSSMIGGAD